MTRTTRHLLTLLLGLGLVGCNTFESIDPYTSSDTGASDAASSADDGGDASDAGDGNDGPAFVAVGEGARIDVTEDGVMWEAAEVGGADASLRLNGVAWGDGRWVAVAFDIDDSSGAVAISDDGRRWSVVDDGTLPQLMGVVYANGQFHTASTPVLRSSDGESWVMGAQLSGQPEEIAFGGGRLVVVGATGDEAMVATSADGVEWTEEVLGGPRLYGVVYGGGRFVAVGDEGRTAVSSDGLQWEEGDVLGPGLNLEVGFDGERFFTTQAGNALFTSTDGLSWTTSGVLGYEHIAHRGGRYVGADGDGRRGWADDLNGFVAGEQVVGASYWYVGARP